MIRCKLIRLVYADLTARRSRIKKLSSFHLDSDELCINLIRDTLLKVCLGDLADADEEQ